MGELRASMPPGTPAGARTRRPVGSRRGSRRTFPKGRYSAFPQPPFVR